jgi:hypothetical protein
LVFIDAVVVEVAPEGGYAEVAGVLGVSDDASDWVLMPFVVVGGWCDLRETGVGGEDALAREVLAQTVVDLQNALELEVGHGVRLPVHQRRRCAPIIRHVEECACVLHI